MGDCGKGLFPFSQNTQWKLKGTCIHCGVTLVNCVYGIGYSFGVDQGPVPYAIRSQHLMRLLVRAFFSKRVYCLAERYLILIYNCSSC
jgi:hypothetical protein